MRHWLTVLSVVVPVVQAQAASFNCAKAQTPIERLICSDPQVSELDDQLDKTYRTAEVTGSWQRSELAPNQREWLRSIRDTCADAECLTRVYRARIEELRGPRKPASDSTAASNLPCLSKVCLGDKATDHVTTVAWIDLAKEARAAYQQGAGDGGTRAYHEEWVVRGVKGLTPEEQKTLVQYLVLGKMDRHLLTLLRERRPAFCRGARFQGLFRSESGYLTSVWAAITSSGTLRVTSLSRQFPASDSVQEAELKAALVAQYPFLNNNFNMTDHPPWTTGLAEYSRQVVTFSLYKNDEDLELTDTQIARQPQCQSAKPSLE
jgi:uncharacterized protein